MFVPNSIRVVVAFTGGPSSLPLAWAHMMKTPKCLMKWQSVVAFRQCKTYQNGIDKSLDCSWQQSSSRVVLSVNVNGALEGQICCTNANRCWSQAAPVAFYLDEWWAESISSWRVAKKTLDAQSFSSTPPRWNPKLVNLTSILPLHTRNAFPTNFWEAVMFTLLIVNNWSFLMLGWPKTHNDPELVSSRRRHCWSVKIIPSFLHKDQPTKVWRVEFFWTIARQSLDVGIAKVPPGPYADYGIVLWHR